MINIGCHLSISHGLLEMAKTAVSIKANTMQFFAGNPRGGSISCNKGIEEFNAFLKDHNFASFVVHAPYVVNLCSNNESIRKSSEEIVSQQVKWLNQMPGNYYNLHPGCHVGGGIKRGIELIRDALYRIVPECNGAIILLETMSGKGSEVGSRFEEIAEMLADFPSVGVCLDTCHVFSAGYDLVNNLDGVLSEFDKVIGLDRLKAIHLNDSMTPFASKKDRHEKIGLGTIGINAIRNIVNHPLLTSLPFILETPNDIDGWAEEIVMMREGE